MLLSINLKNELTQLGGVASNRPPFTNSKLNNMETLALINHHRKLTNLIEKLEGVFHNRLQVEGLIYYCKEKEELLRLQAKLVQLSDDAEKIKKEYYDSINQFVINEL